MGLPIAAAFGAVNFIGGLFTDEKDAERKRNCDQLFSLAINGDKYAEAELRCSAGDTTQAPIVASYGHPDIRQDGNPPCAGLATAVGRDYAKGLVAQLNIRRGIADTAAVITNGAAAVGTEAAPVRYATSVTAGIFGDVDLSKVLFYGALAVAAFYAVKTLKRRGS